MVESTGGIVVIDNGQDTMKVGIAGDNDPKATFETTAGVMAGGRVMNWDQMEAVWAQAFEKLGVKAEDASVVVTEAIFNPQMSKE